MSVVDTDWFKDRLQDRGLSMRKMASMMDLDVSAVSLTLNGKRKMGADEAAKVARLLGVPVDEVLRHAGVDVRGSVPTVPIVGWMDGDGVVHDGRGQGPSTAPAPATGAELVAVRAQTRGFVDGWIFYYQECEGVSLEAVGRLCVVQVTRETGRRIRWVTRGYEPGLWNLGRMGTETLESASLMSASPIIWIRQ